MSKEDLLFLEQLRMSPAQVAAHLRVSRQAVYVGIGKEKLYFDLQRKKQLKESLQSSDVKAEHHLAELIEIDARDQMEAADAEHTSKSNGGFVRFGFSQNPQTSSFLEELDATSEEKISAWAIVCYVLPDQRGAELLGATIAAYLARTGDIASRVSIFESNIAAVMPNSTFCCSQTGIWSGHYGDLIAEEHPYSAEYTTRIRVLLAAAGFGFGAASKPRLTYPNTEVFGYSGFAFRCTYDSKGALKL